MTKLLEIMDLRTSFFTAAGEVKAVNGLSFDLLEGETVGLVGESGSGKSVAALSLLRLIPSPPGRIVGGEVRFQDEDLLRVDDARLRQIRGNEIAMIFQEPMTSLNPVMTVGRQITEALELHKGMKGAAARRRAAELLEMVGIPSAEERLNDYPHQFSGGMRQRVMIAMALSCDPKILLADEPTTALDVTIQAQVLELLARLTHEFGAAVILITHNLGVVARYADRVHVMYAGRIIESAPAAEIFARPRHAYTLGLLESVPRLDAGLARLVPIEGVPPDPINLPPGCEFAPRCRFATDVCRDERPDLREQAQGHFAACHHADQVLAAAMEQRAPGAAVASPGSPAP